MNTKQDLPNTYVIGFAIDPQYDEVALILKKRGPAFNLHKWNGIGGHVKVGESPVGAMRRESLEEMGLDLPASGQWQEFHYERRIDGPKLHFFTAAVPDLERKVQTLTDEEVKVFSIQQILSDLTDVHHGEGGYGSALGISALSQLGDKNSEYVYNLGYLVLMAYSWLKNPQHAYLEG